MNRIGIKQTLSVAALFLGTALPVVSHADPCPAMPRRYTPTMEHQISDDYDVYAADLRIAELEDNIDKLTLAYHNRHPRQKASEDAELIPTVPEPDFIPFFGKDSSPEPGHFQNLTQAYHLKSPNLQNQCKKGSYCYWAWGVNPKHNDFNASYFGDPQVAKNLRCRPEGVTLIGYVLPQNVSRTDTDFLVTIADLTRDHLPFLKELKTQTLAYLKDKFAYDSASDTAQLYFHWPTGLRTSVLHLHSKINFSMSPTESLRAFTLDEVIYALEHPTSYPKGITSLISSRWGAFGAVLLEKSDDNDVALWSILNGGKKPTSRGAYFKWIADAIRTAWYDPATQKLSLQVTTAPGKEMTSSFLITDAPRASYKTVIKDRLPKEVTDRVDPGSGIEDDPNLYAVVRCLYPAGLKLFHGEEKDTIYHDKCLHYDRDKDQVRMIFPPAILSPLK